MVLILKQASSKLAMSLVIVAASQDEDRHAGHAGLTSTF